MSRRRKVRLFFCTDLHGSDVCFRKFLHAGPVYGAGNVIMGGDCTGKMVVPFVEDDGGYRCAWDAGPPGVVAVGGPLEQAIATARNSGFYPALLSAAEHKALTSNPAALAALFRDLISQRLREWLTLAEERLRGTDVHVVMTPGNDDEFFVDDVLAESDFVDTPEGRIGRIADYEVISLSWASPTPWDTPRECSEEELGARIDALAERLEDPSRAIFNLHPPPYGSGLDVAPQLTENGEMIRGGAVLASVGSHAVRDAIAKYQPALSLHGHIHESRGIQWVGRTLCVNPGSTYSQGTLQGVVVDLRDGTVRSHALVAG